MTISLSFCRLRTLLHVITPALLTVFCIASTAVAASKSPVLLSESTSTRAIALEAVTLKSEPFSLTSDFNLSSDRRTRICIFATNLELLAGEGAKAFSAEAEDGAHNFYPLTIEYAGQVPPAMDFSGNMTADFRGIWMIVVRLNDQMSTAGDVLLRLNLHGMSSNRVRVGIGQIGGGPANDVGAVPTPAPAMPPPAEPVLTPDPYTSPATDGDTIRLLEQASWGPTRAEVARVKAMGFQAYLDEQFNSPVLNPAKGSNYPNLFFPPDDQGTACPSSVPGDPNYNETVCNRDNFSLYPVQRTYFTNSLYGQDQLRQRVAFALHQIIVVSGISPLNRPSWITMYLQALDRGAFGNYRTLLGEITLNPSMGEYLDMRLSTRRNPNENWAREVLQLFSIGVNELNIDGTPKLDAQGAPIPSYTQATVTEFTRVFTGWNLDPTLIAPGTNNWRDPMVPRGGNNQPHDMGAKHLLRGVVTLPCVAPTTSQQCAQSDLNVALDNIFNHPNLGPFVGKQLIQHLVTSNPSPAYVERVARVFNNDCDALYPQNCTGIRGDMKAVVRAVLLDPEARGDVKTDPKYGKLRDPAQYVNNVLRALNVKSFDKTSNSDGVLASRSSTNFTSVLDQPIFLPATVFSYYHPDYEVPGAKILGPAFGILSTATTLRRANDINTLVYSGVTANTAPTAASPDRPRGTSVDLSDLEALAGEVGKTEDARATNVANSLSFLLLHNTMSAQMRASIVTAIKAIPSSDTNFARKRAQMAAYLVATSSQYDIQR